eukprot:TRINITY_DN30822_c0_g1_i1.p1 TRINITY_DN30822_c0_g1~~TRINITY_DN30822_c0_g1_i1.p1  ORF type:complete len:420 (-),score=52.24 TRINITY_DN30822_c0_g1_i1:422-1681(-)
MLSRRPAALLALCIVGCAFVYMLHSSSKLNFPIEHLAIDAGHGSGVEKAASNKSKFLIKHLALRDGDLSEGIKAQPASPKKLDVRIEHLALQDGKASDGIEKQKASLKVREMSVSCKCALNGECASSRPIRRFNYTDDMLVIQKKPNVRGEPLYKLDEKKWKPRSRRSKGRSLFLSLRERCQVEGKQVVYLTYDDGIDCKDPACGRAYDFLDAADWLGVKTTQFVITARVANATTQPCPGSQEACAGFPKNYRDASIRALLEFKRRGHVIGSHTHTHPDLRMGNFDDLVKDIRLADDTLTSLLSGERPEHFRPPYVGENQRILKFLIGEMGYRVWGGENQGGTDWADVELPSSKRKKYAAPAARLVRDVLLKRGNSADMSVVLTLHDRPHSLRYLEDYVTEICNVCPSCEFQGLPHECA